MGMLLGPPAVDTGIENVPCSNLLVLAVTCTVPEQYLDYVTAFAYEHKEVSR